MLDKKYVIRAGVMEVYREENRTIVTEIILLGKRDI